jgi:hypothetical protein
VILASIGYEMWYFGVLLYQLCTLDGQTLWKVDQADNISKAEMLDLAFRWVCRHLMQRHSFLSTCLGYLVAEAWLLRMS